MPSEGWATPIALNSEPISVRPSPSSRLIALSISAAFSGEASALSDAARFFDAEVAEEFGLGDRPGHARAHAFGGDCKGLKIDMGGQIDRAGRLQRIDEGVAADRLQSIARARFRRGRNRPPRRPALTHHPAA